jgi:hypothetical protein
MTVFSVGSMSRTAVATLASTPRRLSAPASEVTRRSRSPHVVLCPRKRSAVALGCISAWPACCVDQFCRRAKYGCSVGGGAVNGQVLHAQANFAGLRDVYM